MQGDDRDVLAGREREIALVEARGVGLVVLEQLVGGRSCCGALLSGLTVIPAEITGLLSQRAVVHVVDEAADGPRCAGRRGSP